MKSILSTGILFFIFSLNVSGQQYAPDSLHVEVETIRLDSSKMTASDSIHKKDTNNYNRPDVDPIDTVAEKQYTIQARPVDKREHYVKRCVALPGDTLAVRGGHVYIDGNKHMKG